MLITLMAMAVTSLALAQGGPPRGGGQGGPGGPGGPGRPQGGPAIIMIPEVQTELHLTDSQKNEVKVIMDANRPPRPEPGSPPPNPGDGRGMVERIHTALKAKLNSTQFARLLQLELQAEGVHAILREDVAAELGLSADQKNQIRTILENNRPPRPEPGTPPPTPEQMDQQRQEVERKVLAVLSADQKSEWASMKGAAFTFPRRGPGGPGGPGGGPGGGGRGGRGGGGL